MSMKNSNVTIGNRTRDLPTFGHCLNQLHQRVPTVRSLWSALIAETALFESKLYSGPQMS